MAVLARMISAALLIAATAAAAAQVGQGADGDWANVGRYRAANEPLVSRPMPRRVVFMGDSITEGWASRPFIGGHRNFVGRGISGQTTPQMLLRFRSDVIALKPEVVHIMGGTNDIAGNTGPETQEEIVGYITSMVELARANGIKIVLASVPPAADFPWRHGLNPAPKIRSLNARLKEFAARRNIAYVDYWRVLASPDGAMKPQYSGDGVHPNAAGYAAMEPLASAALARAMRER
ncbi:MAG TPA: SGNH/GDSL hydrolase family protein [Sphingomicrobium sp.]|jgi:lysophospholipase L1-like esterase